MYLAIIFMSKFPTPQVHQCIYILGTWSRKKLTFRFLAKRVVLLGAQGSTIRIAPAIVQCLNLLLILHLIAERKPDTNRRVQPHITIFWYWYPNFFLLNSLFLAKNGALRHKRTWLVGLRVVTLKLPLWWSLTGWHENSANLTFPRSVLDLLTFIVIWMRFLICHWRMWCTYL